MGCCGGKARKPLWTIKPKVQPVNTVPVTPPKVDSTYSGMQHKGKK